MLFATTPQLYKPHSCEGPISEGPHKLDAFLLFY